MCVQGALKLLFVSILPAQRHSSCEQKDGEEEGVDNGSSPGFKLTCQTCAVEAANALAMKSPMQAFFIPSSFSSNSFSLSLLFAVKLPQ